MKNSFIYAAKTALYLLLLTGLFAACDNSTGSEEEEQEPVAIRVKQNNQTIVERNNATNTTTGTLTITAGSTSTSTFTVLFVDEIGAEFTPDPEEHSIEVTSTSGIVTFTNINSESAPFSFDAQANDAGTTTFQIVMNHVGAPEFTATALPLEVSASN